MTYDFLIGFDRVLMLRIDQRVPHLRIKQWREVAKQFKGCAKDLLPPLALPMV